MNFLYLFLFMLVQQAMSVAGQLLLKLGMASVESFSWKAVGQLFLNLYLQIGLWLLIAANVFWLWLLNKYPFSIVYPLTSLGFVFSVITGMLIFHEHVSTLHWIGVLLVMIGCFCIAGGMEMFKGLL